MHILVACPQKLKFVHYPLAYHSYCNRSYINECLLFFNVLYTFLDSDSPKEDSAVVSWPHGIAVPV